MRASEGKSENSHRIEKREEDVPSMNDTKQRTFVSTLSNQIKSNQIKKLYLSTVISSEKMLFPKNICPLRVAKHQLKVACKQALRSRVYLSWPRACVHGAKLGRIGAPLPQSSRRSLRSPLAPNICRTKTLACTLTVKEALCRSLALTSALILQFAMQRSTMNNTARKRFSLALIYAGFNSCCYHPRETPGNKTLLSRPIPGVGVESS